MLKWLRKYNTWIMVVAGSLLMVTFLLQQAISDLAKQQVAAPTVRVNGSRVDREELSLAYSEYAVLSQTLQRETLARQPLRIEEPMHWYLLSRLAVESGYAGGPNDGQEFTTNLFRVIYGGMGLPDDQIAQLEAQFSPILLADLKSNSAKAKLNDQQLNEMMGKLAGVVRMRTQLFGLPRLSDRRLAVGYRKLRDSTGVDYVFVPADREVSKIPTPSADELSAFFDKHRDVRLGEGEFGVGYRQPPRVKIEWMTISRRAIEQVATPDDVEVQKRFLKRYPTGTPSDGQTSDQALAAIQAEMKQDAVDRILKAGDQAIRAELDKALRLAVQDGRYWVLPADWNAKRPTLESLASAAAARMSEVAGAAVPVPAVSRAADAWQTKTMLNVLPGIGQAVLQRGNRPPAFADVVLNVKEIAGVNDLGLQVGLPGEAFTDDLQNRYYCVILDAKPEGPPESIDEVRPFVVSDMLQIEGFKRLKAQLDEYRAKAVAGGFEALNITEFVGGVVPFATLAVNSADISRDRAFGQADNFKSIDYPEVRDAIAAAAEKLDPTKPLGDVPADQRFVAVAVPNSRGLCVAKVTRLNPVTAEALRTSNRQAAVAVVRKEFLTSIDQDPFTFANLRQRMNVEIEQRGGQDEEDDTKTDQTTPVDESKPAQG